MKYLLIVSFLIVGLLSFSQDGKIVEQTEYTNADSTIKNAERSIPDIKNAIGKVNFYHITYLSDGLKVKGYMAIPNETGKFPCVIFNRGGNREFSAITNDAFLRLVGKLAAAGYVVVASQYRGNAGGEGTEEFGGKDLNDVLNLIPLLSTVSKADTSRIGMFGWSRGGMMTYMALTKTNKIKAAVIGSGLADLPKAIESRPEFDTLWAKIIPDFTTNKTEVLAQRSATSFAAKMNKTTPLLILQGTADWRVPTNQVLDLVNILYKIKHPFRFILYEGGQHSLIEHKADYSMQIENWFNTYLRDRKPWPSLEPHGL
jgi:dipeptidyl aminopeptidase/acylaminoacyl peptidase